MNQKEKHIEHYFSFFKKDTLIAKKNRRFHNALIVGISLIVGIPTVAILATPSYYDAPFNSSSNTVVTPASEVVSLAEKAIQHTFTLSSHNFAQSLADNRYFYIPTAQKKIFSFLENQGFISKLNNDQVKSIGLKISPDDDITYRLEDNAANFNNYGTSEIYHTTKSISLYVEEANKVNKMDLKINYKIGKIQNDWMWRILDVSIEPLGAGKPVKK